MCSNRKPIFLAPAAFLNTPIAYFESMNIAIGNATISCDSNGVMAAGICPSATAFDQSDQTLRKSSNHSNYYLASGSAPSATPSATTTPSKTPAKSSSASFIYGSAAVVSFISFM
jgi:hypothetical protein